MYFIGHLSHVVRILQVISFTGLRFDPQVGCVALSEQNLGCGKRILSCRRTLTLRVPPSSLSLPSQRGVDGEDHIRVGRLNLVDLAGSERQSKTGSTVSLHVEKLVHSFS